MFGDIPNTDVLTALRYILNTEPEVAEDLPERLAEVISRCIARAPQDRPPTAAALAGDLEGLAP